MTNRVDVLASFYKGNLIEGASLLSYVQTPSGVLYHFYVAHDSDLLYRKSFDGGFTWSKGVLIFAGTVFAAAIYYDKWSGLPGNLIHIVYTDTAVDDTFYVNLNTVDDAVSVATTVFAGASAVQDGGHLSLVRAAGGNLLCHTNIDAGAEGGFFRSVDVGANWTSRTLNEALAIDDQIVLLPGKDADTQDVMGIFSDASANEMSVWRYDDSANTWAETSIATAMVSVKSYNPPYYPRMAGATHPDLSFNVVVAWSAINSAGAKLRCWTVSASAIVEKTPVINSSGGNQGLCNIAINRETGDWYVVYVGKEDGTEKFPTSPGNLAAVYYKVSKDQGVTWGNEILLSANRWVLNSLLTSMHFSSFFSVIMAHFDLTVGAQESCRYTAVLNEETLMGQVQT